MSELKKIGLGNDAIYVSMDNTNHSFKAWQHVITEDATGKKVISDSRDSYFAQQDRINRALKSIGINPDSRPDAMGTYLYRLTKKDGLKNLVQLTQLREVASETTDKTGRDKAADKCLGINELGWHIPGKCDNTPSPRKD